MSPSLLALFLASSVAPVHFASSPATSPPQDAVQETTQEAASEAERGYLGIQMELEDGWMSIRGIFEGSPAQAGGLQVGDQLRIPNMEATSMNQLTERLAGLRAGQKVAFEVRRDGWTKQMELELVPRSAIDTNTQIRTRPEPAPREGADARGRGRAAEQEARGRARAAEQEARRKLRELRGQRGQDMTAEAPEPPEAPEPIQIEATIEEVEEIEETETSTFQWIQKNGEGEGRVIISSGDGPARVLRLPAGAAGEDVEIEVIEGQAGSMAAELQALRAEVASLQAQMEELRALRGEIRRVIELLERR